MLIGPVGKGKRRWCGFLRARFSTVVVITSALTESGWVRVKLHHL